MNTHLFRSLEILEPRIAPAATTVPLSDLNGSDGFEISTNGIVLTQLGGAVATDSDVNGDGFDDLIIGAPFGGTTGEGAVYVVFGRAGGVPATFDPATLNGTNGFTISGAAAGDNFGAAVGSIGDFDDDGFDDIIVGAPEANSPGAGTPETGAAYVIFGQGTSFAAAFNVSALNGANGFTIYGQADGDEFGRSVDGESDLNDDGIDDLIVGASLADPGGGSSGAAYVIFGQTATFPPVFDLGTLTGINGFRIVGESGGDFLGTAVAGLSDLNGDGRDDFAVGAPSANEGTAAPGAAYVIFGRGAGAGLPFPANLNPSLLNGTDGFKITAQTSSGAFGLQIGASIFDGGDFNGDGLDEVIVGVPLANNQGTSSGGAAVVFGRTTAFPAKIFDTEIRGAAGFILFGERSESFAGLDVAGAGDFNGDGFDDIVVGAPGVGFAYTESPGKTYVIFGRAEPIGAPLKLKDFASERGVLFLGEAASDRSGVSVGFGGDFNDDGFDDLLIGASGAGPNDSGAAYLVYGTPAVQKAPGMVTFTDPDGDRVTVRLTRGQLEAGDLVFEQVEDGALLREINLAGKVGLDGASLILTVQKTAAAENTRGLASGGGLSIGKLDASGLNLKKIKIPGNLVTLLGGDGSGDGKLRGVKALTTGSLGTDGENFPGMTSQLYVPGGIGKLKVLRDIDQLVGNLGGGLAGGLGKLIVGGALQSSQLDIAGLLASLDIRDGIHQSTVRVGSDIRNMIVLGDVSQSDVLAGGAMANVLITGALTDSEIFAPGRLNPDSLAKAAAIRRLIVNGDVRNSSILAGHDASGAPVNADAGLGKVTIKGDFEASNLVAGVARTGAYFGDGDDPLIAGGNAIVARIASITIKGAVLGSTGAGDHFGIVAEEIAQLKIGGVVQPLSAGPGNDLAGLALGGTSDVKAREVVAI